MQALTTFLPAKGVTVNDTIVDFELGGNISTNHATHAFDAFESTGPTNRSCLEHACTVSNVYRAHVCIVAVRVSLFSLQA